MQCTCALLSPVASPAPQYFSTLSHKRHDFRKTFLNTKCVFRLPLQLLSKTFLILRTTERDMIKNYVGLHVKHPLFFSNFNANWIFSTDFRKTRIYQISLNSVQWEPSCSTWSDGRTDWTKLWVAFRNFADAPKNYPKVHNVIFFLPQPMQA
jgi:hypothetical protein